MATRRQSDKTEVLTDLQKRFCEIHATEKHAGKAWNQARFSLGMTAEESMDVARVQASRAKARVAVRKYLEQCRGIVAGIFPNGIPDPKKEAAAGEPRKINVHSKYKPEYCDAIRRWFDVPHTKTVEVVIQVRDRTIMKQELQPVAPPHMSAFARSIGTTNATLRDWAAKYPEFQVAYQDAKDMFEEHIVDGALLGQFNPQFTKFVAVNRTDMRDKTAVDVTSEGRALAPTVSVVPPEPTPAQQPESPQEGGGA